MSRNTFRDAFGAHWEAYRNIYRLKATMDSHSCGTDRIALRDVVTVIRDYLVKPGIFSTIYKTGCCLTKDDHRWGKTRTVPHHSKYNHKSIKQSIEKDIKFEKPCSCGNQKQITLFPKLLLVQVPKNQKWEDEYVFEIEIYQYRLTGIVYYNDTGKAEDQASNHVYICILVCLISCITFLLFNNI